MTRLRAVTLAGAATLALATPALATQALAQPLTREDLETALAQRDREIAALETRIAALEAERSRSQSASAGAAAVGPDDPPAGGAAGDKPADDEAALQALSRGLVQKGLLLLPPWSVEATPSLAYSHSQQQGLALVDTPEGISTVNSQRLRDDGLEASVSARVGLPWRSQLQVSLPVDWKRDSSALGDGSEVTHSETHIGDLQVELAHQFVTETNWRPDVIAAVSVRAPTGANPYRAPVAAVANGLGTSEFTGRVSVLKSLDPLVVFSNLSYSGNLSYRQSFGRVHPGDDVDWQLGALFAVSPDTSLSFGFDQQFKFDTRVDGARIPGSDGVAAVAQIGLDQVINARTLLDVTLGLGVTKDAPDYQIMVSLPIRFR